MPRRRGRERRIHGVERALQKAEGMRRWIALSGLLAIPLLANAQEETVGDMGPPPDEGGAETADSDSWGTGFEDDDTFGDTDALDHDAHDDTTADTERTDRDSWGTGFEDDDTFGDTDAFDDDAFDDSEHLDRRPES